jgi:hypothetical protein
MQTSQLIFKHRASEPLPAMDRADRPGRAGAHRATRVTDRMVAAVLGLALFVLVAYLIAR